MSSGGGTQRYQFIHALRGVAALLVMWSHLSGMWLLNRGETSDLQDAWQQFIVAPFHVYQNGGHLGVVLFFLVSGFVITHASLRETRSGFGIKRVMRIFPTLAVALGLSALLLWFANRAGYALYGVNNASLAQWLSSVFLLDGFVGNVRPLDVTWTLVIEIAFYVLTAVLIYRSRQRPLYSTWVMLLLWLAVSVFGMTIGMPGINDGLLVYVAWLIIGRFVYLASTAMVTGFDAVVGSGTALLAFFCFLEAGEHGFLLAPGGWTGVEPLVTYLGAIVIFTAALRWNPSVIPLPLRFLGDVSYSLYLVHLPVGIMMLNVLAQWGVNNSVATVTAGAASLGVAWLMFKVVESPSQMWGRKLADKWQARLDRAVV